MLHKQTSLWFVVRQDFFVSSVPIYSASFLVKKKKKATTEAASDGRSSQYFVGEVNLVHFHHSQTEQAESHQKRDSLKKLLSYLESFELCPTALCTLREALTSYPRVMSVNLGEITGFAHPVQMRHLKHRRGRGWWGVISELHEVPR